MSITPTSLPKAPELTPVAFLSLKLSEPKQVISSTDYKKVLNYVEVLDGSIKTVENKLGLELDVENIFGNDHIEADTKAGINVLDCNIYGKTPSGTGVHIKYAGLIGLTDSLAATLGQKNKLADFDAEYINSNPFFKFDDSVEDKYKWASQTFIYAKGRFIRDDKHLYVQYYLYAVK